MADTELEIRAVIIDHVAAQPDHSIVAIERDLGIVDAV